MRVFTLLPATLLLTSAAAPCFAFRPIVHTAHTKSHAAAQQSNIKHSSAHTSVHKSLHVAPVAARHESVGMPSERATEIQSALIQRGYLSGEPSGVWDSQTAAAMEKLQGENGWQTKVVPDSRALIKLGLGGPATPPQP